MLRSRKQRYIFWGLLFLLIAVFIEKIIENREIHESHKVQIAILIEKGSEQKHSDLMSGIRDYSRENDILIHMNYMDRSDSSDISGLLEVEKELGSAGAFVVYPETFYEDRTGQEIDTDVQVLVVSNEQIEAFAQFAKAYYQKRNDRNLKNRLEDDDIMQLMDGTMERLLVVNEYQLGYSCMDALAKGSEKEQLSDIPVNYLELTTDQVAEGRYNALLSDR